MKLNTLCTAGGNKRKYVRLLIQENSQRNKQQNYTTIVKGINNKTTPQ
jgi:hypothetical protein